jgi:hypothetical protein
MLCPTCNRRLAPDARFCDACGAHVEAPRGDASSPQRSAAETPLNPSLVRGKTAYFPPPYQGGLRGVGGAFVGRQREMAELVRALEDAISGRGRLVTLVGEPGIGKTRTAQELSTITKVSLIKWNTIGLSLR